MTEPLKVHSNCPLCEYIREPDKLSDKGETREDLIICFGVVMGGMIDPYVMAPRCCPKHAGIVASMYLSVADEELKRTMKSDVLPQELVAPVTPLSPLSSDKLNDPKNKPN